MVTAPKEAWSLQLKHGHCTKSMVTAPNLLLVCLYFSKLIAVNVLRCVGVRPTCGGTFEAVLLHELVPPSENVRLYEHDFRCPGKIHAAR